ncbi:hypothetical protein [Lichenicoccus sp.]|uniref:hypothetical protein n=1 Tax=Lichenicoccus sp. TaxID=2781899 RepID=UPI003D0CBDCF
MGPGIGTFDILLLVGAVLILFLLLGPLLTIPLHIPLNYNEGWNAYLDQRAVVAGAGPLYPAANSLVFNNYPPLSFYLVGAIGRYVVGDMIVAGRIVAITSLLASAALLGVCVRMLGGRLRGSLAASGLLLLYSSTFFRDYVAMDDPQWLAHALMLGGLAVLLRGQATRYPASHVATAAALMVAGGFVKHNLVGLPLAVTIWLAVIQPRAATVWLAASIGGVGLGLVATQMLFGHAAFVDILAHHRVFRAGRVIKALQRLIPLLPMMLIAGLAFRRRLQGDQSMLLAALFVVISLMTGIVQRLGEGVYYNAHFETMLALCLTTGLLISRIPAAGLPFGSRAIGPAALLGFAVIPIVVMMPWQLRRAWVDIDDRIARARSWQPTIARIAASPGVAGCESLSLCFWAHKPFTVDVFNLDQSILMGASIMRFDGLASTHAFGVFEYSGDSFSGMDAVGNPERDPLLLDLQAHGYTPIAKGPGEVLLLGASNTGQRRRNRTWTDSAR